MNGLSYPINNDYAAAPAAGGGGNRQSSFDSRNYNDKLGGYDHVEDGGGDSFNEDEDAAFDSNNIESYFDQEADENQGIEDDADLDGYLNDLYGSESAPDHHVHESTMNLKPTEAGPRRNESSKGLYEIAVKKVNNENVYEYTCKLCSKLTIGSKEILRHLKKEHGKEFDVYECKMCDFATQYRASLNRHKRSVHGAKKSEAAAAAAAAAALSKTLPAKLEKNEVVMIDSSSEPSQDGGSSSNNNANDRRSLRSSASQLNKDSINDSSQNSRSAVNGHHNGGGGGGGGSLSRTHSGTSLQNGARNGALMNGSQSQHRFGQNGFSSFRRPIVTVSHIYKKYQCSACSLKSKNLFDIRKHINQKHRGQAEVQMNKDYVGHYKKIVSKYTPIARPTYNGYASANHNNKDAAKQQSTSDANSSRTSNGGANYMDTSDKRAPDALNASNQSHSFNETNGSAMNQNGYEAKEEEEETDVNPAVQDFKALLNQYELRLTGLDINYRTLNMNVVNIDTRLTTLDSRIVRIEDKLETILKLLQKP